MPSTEDAEQAFPGDGEMARRMRAHDWAATPLGEPSPWPSSLQTACRICLTSSFPMVVWCTLIMGPLAELRARLAGRDESVREDLEVIHRNRLRLGKLVNALLDVSRIEAGRTQAQFEPVDLAAYWADTWSRRCIAPIR